MARRSFFELRTIVDDLPIRNQVDGNWPGQLPDWKDNRLDLFSDIIDTLRPAYSAMVIDSTQTQDFSPIPSTLTAWTDTPEITTPDFTADEVGGIVTANIPMVLSISLHLSMKYGIARDGEFEIQRVGSILPSPFRAFARGAGINRPVNLALSGIFVITDPPEQFEVVISNTPFTETYEFLAGSIIFNYVPILTIL